MLFKRSVVAFAAKYFNLLQKRTVLLIKRRFSIDINDKFYSSRWLQAFFKLVDHLRHFTKLRDSKGQWHFFRFQEPLVMRTIVMGLPDHARRSFLAPFQRVIVPDRSDVLHLFDIRFDGVSGR